MVLFSCFPAHISCHKPKKMLQLSAECMHKKAQDHLQEFSSRGSSHSPISDATYASSSKNPCASSRTEKLTRSSSFHMPATASTVMSPDPKFVSGSCVEEPVHMHIHSSNTERLHVSCLKKHLHASCLKKSKSLSSGLGRDGRFADVFYADDETDQGLSCENVREVNPPRIFSSVDNNESAESSENKEYENRLDDLSGVSHHDEDALIEEPCKMHIGTNQDDCRVLDDNTSEKNLMVQCSFSTETEDNRRKPKSTSCQGPSGSRSRSYGDLLGLKSSEVSEQAFIGDNSRCCSPPASLKSENVSLPNVSDAVSLSRHQHVFQEKSEDCGNSVRSDNSGRLIDRHTFDGGNFDARSQSNGHSTSSLKDNMIIQEISRENMEKIENGNPRTHDCVGYPRHWWDGLSSEEFNVKRIEHWVSTIDIENCNSLEEVGECSSAFPEAKEDSTETGVSSGKLDSRIQNVVQVANSYISTLGASSASAQMANFGLPVIPQLSIFHSLRFVNLSGNAIVRITAGALPKGLHVLNLSKNYISTIEGLRELTRLRVLDLSYNRIFRIGRGLASCASLKELYLAGNKISEVEGLHRLLKLNILDLSYNKISTAKCLGQLAANYSSLHVLNLDGNPAQKNVGDEQLKKSLMSLLPHLVYLNRQPVKASSSKEASDRASRSVSMHQFERGIRSDHKIARKASYNSLIKTSGNGALIQAVTSSKQSKGHIHGRLPPSRSKVTHHQVNLDRMLVGAQLTSSMRRSRSEGTMNVL